MDELFDNDLVLFGAAQRLAAGEVIDQQKVIKCAAWHGYPRGERLGGVVWLNSGNARLKRSQKVQQVLLGRNRKGIERRDHLVRLGGSILGISGA